MRSSAVAFLGGCCVAGSRSGRPVLAAIWGCLGIDTGVVACGQQLSRIGSTVLARLSVARYLLCAICTACGVSYAMGLACRQGVTWATEPWLQLHGLCTSVALLVAYALREAVATAWRYWGIDPHAEGAPLGSCLARESLLHGGWKVVEPGGELL